GRRDHHRRGARARRRAQPASRGVRRGGRDAVRLLHERDAHLRDGVAAPGPATDGRSDPRCARAQPLPLWRVHARDTRDQARGRGGGGGIRSGDRTEPHVTWGEREPERVEERIRIEPDGTVVALSGKIEFGQGIRTAFAQLVADELDVPIEKVRVVLGDTDHVPHDMGTFGSRSVAQEAPLLRRAAAYARELRARGKPIEGAIPTDVRLRPDAERRYVGKPMPRLEARDIVTGKARFVADVRVPGMAYGAIVRSPVRNAPVRRVDDTAARAMP